MILIGLTGWSDHDSITIHKQKRLIDYTSHFPVVEADTSFYAIPNEGTIQGWIDQTPAAFQFLPKAHQTMTLHSDCSEHFESEKQLFRAYRLAIQPLIEHHKLQAVLFQFPPYFGCTSEHVLHLKKIRAYMGTTPIAVEFRNNSWYKAEYLEKTFQLLTSLDMIHTTVDQPQTPNNSVPSVFRTTNKKQALVRLHGRNFAGWANANKDPDWRSQRTLYNYSDEELIEIAQEIRHLEKETAEVVIIFNNNSGGHAAENAKRLQKILGVHFEGLAPQQLGFDLF